MLEAKLITLLVEALTMWETPPYYTNDAQDVIARAVSLAADSEWEKPIDEILNPEFKMADLPVLEKNFLEQHPEFEPDDLKDASHKASTAYHSYLQEVDRQENHRVIETLKTTISRLEDSIGEKVHNRNLQIAGLKLKLENNTQAGIIRKAYSQVGYLMEEVYKKKLGNQEIYDQLVKIRTTLG